MACRITRRDGKSAKGVQIADFRMMVRTLDIRID